MMIAHIAKPPSFKRAFDQEASIWHTSDIDASLSSGPYSNFLQHVAAVYYKPSVDQELKIAHHTVLHDDDSKKLAQG